MILQENHKEFALKCFTEYMKPTFYACFNLERIMSRFLKIKKLNLSENTPQNLTVIDWISNSQKVTAVTNLSRFRDFLNRRIS